MRTLYIDLASHRGALACVDDDRMVFSTDIDHRIDDAELIPHVEGLLPKAGWSYRDLTHIACVVGPGGFTSLRVAVALANILSHELDIPSCGVHLSDVYELRITNYELRKISSEIRIPQTAILWLHSTKKHELFVCGFDDLQKQFPEPTCISVDQLKTILTKDVQWIGELIPEHRQIVDAAGAREAQLRPTGEILPTFLRNQNYKKRILQPWYGRGW